MVVAEASVGRIAHHTAAAMVDGVVPVEGVRLGGVGRIGGGGAPPVVVVVVVAAASSV
jgi:hypothetical protein